jgi:peptidoglycan/xylan/chitin deacetylase (PgdA/CDA1 family)
MATLGLSFLALSKAGGMVDIPTPEPAKDNGFTVLCYHRFVARPETVKKPLSEYRLPIEEFKWQMQYLKDQGIEPVSMDQLKAYWFEGKPLPDKAVLLTFDDGFRSIYEKAYPVVKQFGYPGVLFLYTDFIRAQSDAMRYSEIEEMQKNGFDLESHTKSHMKLASEGDKRSPVEYKNLLKEELNEPLTFIQNKFGVLPKILAYSYGSFNEEVLIQTRESGYQMAFTVNPGSNDRTVPPLKLRRNLVLYPMNQGSFKKIFETKVLHLESFWPGDGELIESNEPAVRGMIRDDIKPKSIHLQLGDQVLTVKYDPKTHEIHHQVKAPLKWGGHTLILEAMDINGQRRSYSWYFRVKHQSLKKGKTKE